MSTAPIRGMLGHDLSDADRADRAESQSKEDMRERREFDYTSARAGLAVNIAQEVCSNWRLVMLGQDISHYIEFVERLIDAGYIRTEATLKARKW